MIHFILLFLSLNANAQISGGTQDVNIVSGSVSVSGTSAVTQSGAWNVTADTELLAPTTLADALANPTISGIANYLLGFNGTTWDRLRSSTANGLVVDVSRVQGTVAVSGPLTDTQLRASAVPVSGPLTDTQLRATPVPISGTVSTGGLTDTQLRATAVPVSGTVTANLGTIAGVATAANQTSEISVLNTIATNTGAQATDTLQTGTITALNGNVVINAQGAYTITALITGTWVATLQAEGLMADGTTWQQIPIYTINTTLPYAQALTTTTNGSFAITGGGYTQIRIKASAFTSGTVTIALNASLAQQTIFSAQLGSWTVQGPGLTKGTQGTTGFATQDLKDAGRASKIYSANFTAATTEGLVTLTPITDGAAGGTATSFVITNGKRLRIQSLCINTRNAGAAAQGVVVNLRVNTAGAVTTTSNLLLSVAAGTSLATANITASNCAPIPDGLEIAGNGTVQIGLSQIGTATANNSVTLVGYEY